MLYSWKVSEDIGIRDSFSKDNSKITDVLEIECNNDFAKKKSIEMSPKAKLTCVNISEKMLKVASGKLRDAEFEVQDVIWKYYNFAVYMAVK